MRRQSDHSPSITEPFVPRSQKKATIAVGCTVISEHGQAFRKRAGELLSILRLDFQRPGPSRRRAFPVVDLCRDCDAGPGFEGGPATAQHFLYSPRLHPPLRHQTVGWESSLQGGGGDPILVHVI